jgi:Tol biopolymer transport system component
MTVAVAATIRVSAVSADPAAADLVSTSEAPAKANGYSYLYGGSAVSADGSRVAFVSTATNLSPLDRDEMQDIYVKDLVSGEIALVSVTAGGVKGDRPSYEFTISGDGSTVAFATTASNLGPEDGDQAKDIYVKNLETGELVLASFPGPPRCTRGPCVGSGNASRPSLSGDGSIVAFDSDEPKLDKERGWVPQRRHVVVRDLRSGRSRIASVDERGGDGSHESWMPVLSADGTKVAFLTSSNNFDSRDGDPDVQDAYVKDLVSGRLTLVSTSSTGTKGIARQGSRSKTSPGACP